MRSRKKKAKTSSLCNDPKKILGRVCLLSRDKEITLPSDVRIKGSLLVSFSEDDTVLFFLFFDLTILILMYHAWLTYSYIQYI
jgi:hypothetical protein